MGYCGECADYCLSARRVRLAAAALLLSSCLVHPQDGRAGDAGNPARVELFSGGDLTSNSAFAYFGLAWALGRDVREGGMRLKLLLGRGGFDYRTTLPGLTAESSIEGDVSLVQAMAGYQWRRGAWTIKGYAGVAWEDHSVLPNDPSNSVRGAEAGLIGQIELWRNIGSRGFGSLDASYTRTFDGYFIQGRLGRRVSQRLSLGLEGAGLGNEEYDNGRGGGFVRLHLRGTELTVSGGVSGTYYAEDISGYAAAGLYTRF